MANAGLYPRSADRIFTAREYTLIKMGVWEAYIVGGVEYRDIFSPKISPYETTYCYHISPVGVPFGICEFPSNSFGSSVK